MYCSQCKFSKYVIANGRKQLICSQAEEIDGEAYLPTNCKAADSCGAFAPEKAEYKSYRQWQIECNKCGIDWRL